MTLRHRSLNKNIVTSNVLTREHLEGGRLARAVNPEEAEALALPDGEGDPVDGGLGLLGVLLEELLHREDVVRVRFGHHLDDKLMISCRMDIITKPSINHMDLKTNVAMWTPL